MSYEDRQRMRKKMIVGLTGVIAATTVISIAINAGIKGGRSELPETSVVAETVGEETTAAVATEPEEEDKRVVIKEYILKNSPNYGYTGKMKVEGLMIHSIAQPQPSAKKQADYFGEENNWEAGVHAFIDANNGTVYHTLPWDQEAWHAGYGSTGLTANSNYIGVEMCESAAEHYTDDYKLVVEDKEQVIKDVNTAYDSAVKLFGELCVKFDLDPLEDGVVISHSEGNERGIASNHGDPVAYWTDSGSGHTMDGFREDVAAYKKKFIEEGYELNKYIK